jgi:hypothetical protein
VRGITVEKRLLGRKGARRHPMSGAGSIKWDGSDEHCLYEVKSTRKVFSLSGRMLRDLFRAAARQGKEAKFIIVFGDYDLSAEVTITPGVDGWRVK